MEERIEGGGETRRPNKSCMNTKKATRPTFGLALRAAPYFTAILLDICVMLAGLIMQYLPMYVTTSFIGRAFQSSTSQLNLSRLGSLKLPNYQTTQRIPQRCSC